LVAALLLAALFLYCVMVFGTLAHLSELAGEKRVFDMMPTGYDVAYAELVLDNLGAEGRDYYLWRQIPLDTIYPFLFAAAFFTLSNWLAQKLSSFATALRLIAYLPVLASLFDYLENVLIVAILKGYPPASSTLVGWASWASIAKSALTTVFFSLLLIILILAGAARVMRKRGR
jgi:hypothetical protein